MMTHYKRTISYASCISATYSHIRLDLRQHHLAINYFLRLRKVCRKSHARAAKRKIGRKSARDRRLVPVNHLYAHTLGGPDFGLHFSRFKIYLPQKVHLRKLGFTAFERLKPIKKILKSNQNLQKWTYSIFRT